MKTINFLLLALLCFLTIGAFAQDTASKGLAIGNKMPNLESSKVIGYAKKSFKTSDYKDKLLILDFWATWCHSCIEALPKNDSLQAKFGDKIQIVLVDCAVFKDTKANVAKFYKNRKTTHKDFKLPAIYEDTQLKALFPHELIPHHIWIYKGVVTAITESSEVTEDNIQRMLNGEHIKLPIKTM